MRRASTAPAEGPPRAQPAARRIGRPEDDFERDSIEISSSASWQRINDDAHQYGGPGNGEFILGDANVYGRVFMSTAGRGIVMGELLAPTASPSASRAARVESE